MKLLLLDKEYVENCEECRLIDKEEIESGVHSKLIDSMFNMLEETKGLGLAVPQISAKENIAMFIMKKSTPDNSYDWDYDYYKENYEVVFNPSITFRSPQKSDMKEGCLTYPQKQYGVVNMQRSKTIGISYRNVDGKLLFKNLKGLDARVFQHEFDHLQGETIFYRK